ncbi:MAG TPA: peptidase inhibitor family I36 protein [Streptomyces sp.]|nr:peptidase inhibitor family I36 protein [Streptomyces sp.]
MKRAIAAAVGIAALCVGGVLAAPAATAATNDGAVASDASAAAAKLYVYRHDSYKGGYYGFAKSDRDFRNNTWTGAANSVHNGASSMKNKTSRAAVMYDGPGYTGRTYYAKPRSSDSDLTNNGFDNRASSLKFR